MTAHWGVLCLPFKSLDSLALEKQLNSIGQTMTPVTHECGRKVAQTF